MFWKKKKKMIDVRELHNRGVRIPRNPGNVGGVATDAEGFVELVGKSVVSSAGAVQEGASDFVNLVENVAPSAPSVDSSGLKKISNQLSELDNKLYKLEQRIELLERKAGVPGGGVGGETGNLIGW